MPSLFFTVTQARLLLSQADGREGSNSIIVSCVGAHVCHLGTRRGVDRPLLRLQAGQGPCWDNRGHGRWTGSQRRSATLGTRWCGDMRKRHRVPPLWKLTLKTGLMQLKMPQTIPVSSGSPNLMGPLQANKETNKQNLSSDPHNGRMSLKCNLSSTDSCRQPRFRSNPSVLSQWLFLTPQTMLLGVFTWAEVKL